MRSGGSAWMVRATALVMAAALFQVGGLGAAAASKGGAIRNQAGLATACHGPVYLAGGDSVPAGTDLTSGEAYPLHLLNDHLTGLQGGYCLGSTAQSGATSADYLANQLPPTAAVLRQAAGRANLVTITVGADDKLLPALLHSCLPSFLAFDAAGALQCEQAIANDAGAWSRLRTNLHTILASYQAVARDRPLTVAVTGYYDPFPDALDAAASYRLCQHLVPASPPSAQQRGLKNCLARVLAMDVPLAGVDALVQHLNQIERSEVSAFTDSSGGRIQFVDVYPLFKAHCTPMVVDITLLGARLAENLGCQGPTWISPSQAFAAHDSVPIAVNGQVIGAVALEGVGVHPNDAGQKAIADQIWQAIGPRLRP